MFLLFIVYPIIYLMPDHAIYISVAEVQVEQHQIAVELKIFSDDLYDVLRNFNPNHKSSNEVILPEEVEDYLSSHLIWSQQDRMVQLDCTKVERNGEAHYIYMTGQLPDAHMSSTISASYLFELFPTQQNIVKVTYGDKKNFHNIKKADQIINLP